MKTVAFALTAVIYFSSNVFAQELPAEQEVQPEIKDWRVVLKEHGVREATLNRVHRKQRWKLPCYENCLVCPSISKRRAWIHVVRPLDEKTMLVKMKEGFAAMRGLPTTLIPGTKRFVEIAFYCSHREDFAADGKLPILQVIPLPILREEIAVLEALNR